MTSQFMHFLLPVMPVPQSSWGIDKWDSVCHPRNLLSGIHHDNKMDSRFRGNDIFWSSPLLSRTYVGQKNRTEKHGQECLPHIG